VSVEEPNNLALAVHANLDGSMERLIRTYQDQLYSYALHMLRNSFDAQEVIQDTFLGAYRALALRYDRERCQNLALRAWLFQITRNLARNRIRARRAVREEALGSDARNSIPMRDQSPECTYRDPSDSDLLERALSQLKPRARELIVLRFLDELTYAEIAGILRTTESSARGKTFRALKQMKLLLRRLGLKSDRFPGTSVRTSGGGENAV
jgi:RNA polymerase sigma-70 factor (ECF subfamily)